MLTKTLFLLSVVVVLTIPTFGQATTGKNIDDHLLVKQAEKATGNTPSNVLGTPYLNDSFADGEVRFHKGNHSIVSVRYNIHNDWIEYQQNNQTYILDPDNRIKEVKIGEDIFVVEKYKSKGRFKYGYFKLIDSGKVTLLAKQVVIFEDYQEAKALESSSSPAKYTRAPDQFFLKIGEGELKKTDRLKEMIESFPDKHGELTDFAKKEKISPRKENEVRKLVDYYNRL
jgi:hypothetical protein